MRKIKLTRELYSLVDKEDYEKFCKHKWCAINCGNGYFYAGRYEKGKLFLMHREIFNLKESKVFVDHVNRNRLDNRKVNLRICNGSQNQGNSKIRKDNKSGYKGVSKIKIKGKKKNYFYWCAQMNTHSNDTRFIKTFKKKGDAIKAYRKASKEYFGAFSSV